MNISAPVPTSLAAAEGSAALPGVERVRSARWFKLAVGLFAVWLAGLILLCVLTANPEPVNAVQISRATNVVVARIVDRQQETIEVLQDLAGGDRPIPAGSLTVVGLANAVGPTEGELLIPIMVLRGTEVAYVLSPETESFEDAAHVYRRTPLAEARIRELLRENARRREERRRDRGPAE